MQRARTLTAIIAVALWTPAALADDAPAASTQEQIDKMDQGVDSIDVSQYPKEQQDNYPVFATKCSKCHTLARPINSPYSLPEEWQAYVTKMSHKPRAGIDEDSAKAIIAFLTYDSSVRKKDNIAAKLTAKAAAKSGETGAKPAKNDAIPDEKTDAPKADKQP